VDGALRRRRVRFPSASATWMNSLIAAIGEAQRAEQAAPDRAA
jgi:hypothetical protein